MKTTVRWLPPMTFVAESESGHGVVIDAAPEVGGRNLGPRPMEMVLMGLGGCTAIDVVSILHKARQRVTDCRVEVSSERAETVPRVFTRIHVQYVITGHDLSEKSVARAVSLSADKYCSVSRMLAASVEITHDYRIEAPE
ncbi:MAG: OsmC family protein [Gammaproteobacteria bacterium]|nr:OsmC family protein [Gammaproteobacteria bacterium]